MAAIVLHDGSKHIPSTFETPQKAQVGTAVVITLPAYAACVGRLQATYTYV